MKTRLSEKSKDYLINLWGYWLTFALGVCMFGANQDPISFSLVEGLSMTAGIASIVLGHVVAISFARNVDLDELRIKEGLTWQEFRAKYGKVLEITSLM